ncbi:MAG: hypothetical protein HQK96_20885, partial [Nitrospirae bacterium]|nr:hypothetical protein [Nitrospirota bacterium]
MNKSEVLSEYATKLYYVKKLKPVAVMLGTSRMLALSPDDVSEYLHGSTYNLALSGSNIYEQYRYFKFVVDSQHVRYVILSLDLFSFNPDNNNKESFTEDRFISFFYYKDYRDSIFPSDALKSSILTLRNNVLNECFSIDYRRGNATWCAKEKAFKQIGTDLIDRDMKNSLKLFSMDKEAYNSEKLKNYAELTKRINYLRDLV